MTDSLLSFRAQNLLMICTDFCMSYIIIMYTIYTKLL